MCGRRKCLTDKTTRSWGQWPNPTYLRLPYKASRRLPPEYAAQMSERVHVLAATHSPLRAAPRSDMADRRTLVSYDDLTAPRYVAPAQLGPPLPSTHQPPAKRRRTHQKAPPRRTNQHVQHWDDPGSNAPEVGYGNGVDVDGEYAAEEEEEEESRELTHEEIWDDSALIDAWNSATAEYEVCCSHMLMTSTNVLGRCIMAKPRSGKRSR